MRSRGVLGVLLLVVLLAGSASAYNLPEWRYGNPLSPVNGRILAMGEAGMAAADGVSGMSLNPALLGKSEGIEVVGTAMVVAAEEARQQPLHDSFDGIIAYNTYAMNMGLYDHYVGGIAWSPGDMYPEFEWVPTVAVGYRPRLDMNYDYHVQFRDNDNQSQPMDKIIADYYADGGGGVNAFAVALGQEVAPEVYVGIAVDFLRGDWDTRTQRVFPADSDSADVESRQGYGSVSGTQFTLGVLVERLHRLDVAVVYRSPFTLTGDYEVRPESEEGRFDWSPDMGEDFEYEYPYSLGLGLEYHPRNQLLTTLTFDVEFTAWSEFKDADVGDLEFDDTIVYRAGVEHGFFDDTFARFGFLYEPSYVDSDETLAAFSAGLGLDVLGVRVDIGGQVGLREYDLEDGRRVRETTTQAMATLAHTF
jgi:hypothetical protein